MAARSARGLLVGRSRALPQGTQVHTELLRPLRRSPRPVFAGQPICSPWCCCWEPYSQQMLPLRCRHEDRYAQIAGDARQAHAQNKRWHALYFIYCFMTCLAAGSGPALAARFTSAPPPPVHSWARLKPARSAEPASFPW
jgi:hypothetical protein